MSEPKTGSARIAELIDGWPDPVARHLAIEPQRKAAAEVDGQHYSAYVAEVKQMLKAGNDDEAAGLLLRLIDAIEREAQFPLAGHTGVPPWYFDTLAAVYKRAGKARERGLLVQRHSLLQARAEFDGQVLTHHMQRAKVAAIDDARPRRLAKPRAATVASVKAGRAAGKAVGLFARLVKTVVKG